MKISIVICTYNPNIFSFSLLLDKISSFAEKSYEIVIVDNNSNFNIANTISTSKLNNLKIIKEKRQGLSFARQTGIRNTSGDYIVFFDDDNLPDNNYIGNASLIFQENKHIGLIGPGKVDVVFFNQKGNIYHNSNKQLLSLYQQKDISYFEYGNSIKCMEVFPEGTGMVLRKEIAFAYADSVDQYKTTGRKGTSLASGDDFQIIYNCIKHGYAAGRSPILSIQHLIPSHKTTTKYIRRLKFGQTYSVPLAKQECFPNFKETNNQIAKTLTSGSFLLGILRIFITPIILKNNIYLNIELARKCGWYYGYHLAAGSRVPWIVKLFINFLKLK